MSKKNKVITKSNGDHVVAPEAPSPVVYGAEAALEEATRPTAEEIALLASVSEPDIQPSPPTPEEIAASAAIRALSAEPVEQEEPADFQGVLTPPTESQEAIAVAATALEAAGDLASARDLRGGDRHEGLIARAVEALKNYNSSRVESFLAAVS